MQFPGSLACLVILQILILNPTLLVPGYFCIPISVLELCSEATVKPPANSVILLGLALKMCRVGLGQRSAHGGKSAPNALPSVLSVVGLSSLAGGNRHYPGPFWVLGTPSGWFFSQTHEYFDPWVRNNPWRREWLHTPVFLPGKSHVQRILEGYRPWGHKELDMTEQLTLPLFSAGLSTQLCPLLPCTLMALISRLWVPLVTSGSWLCSTCFSPQVMNGGCCKSLFPPFLLTKDH